MFNFCLLPKMLIWLKILIANITGFNSSIIS
ncbi:Uncharacterised protein [Aeromonas hydrophila]|nr:Uncharacterised protein [Aeromonas hydrophila]